MAKTGKSQTFNDVIADLLSERSAKGQKEKKQD
jgi:hypothetical protein